jgi:hypothetical protein
MRSLLKMHEDLDEHDSSETTPQPGPGTNGLAEKRVLTVLLSVMFLAVLAALVVNWRTAPPLLALTQGQQVAIATSYRPGLPAASKKPLTQLPTEILAYETIAHQNVPGQADRAAEAVYLTLNVNLEMQISTNVYARVEAFGSSAEAKVKQAQTMRDYSVEATTSIVNRVRPAMSGFSKDQSAYAVTWVNGEYLTFVKTTYRDQPPAQKRDVFLRSLAGPVIAAVESFQRTGKQGIELGAELATASPKPATPGTGTTSTPPAAIDAPGGLGF